MVSGTMLAGVRVPSDAFFDFSYSVLPGGQCVLSFPVGKRREAFFACRQSEH